MRAISVGNHSLISTVCITIFLFFFIFGVPTPVGSLTPILTILVLLWGGINYKKYFLYFPKEIFYFFLFLLFDLMVCLLIPIILNTYDFSIIRTKINFIVSILAVYVLARYFSSNSTISNKYFFNLLLNIFIIQSVLIVLMLLNSEFSQIITSFTRSSDQGARVLDIYSGSRGLGIADSNAFGLAIVMGLFVFLTFFSYNKKIINLKYFILLLLFGGVASISAGRTAILGMILGIIYLLLNFKNIRALIILISTFLILTVAGYFLLNIDRQAIQDETLGYFYSYSMEPILNYVNEGSLSSTSTDTLHNMYFPLTEQQFFIGDGRYMNGESYYMETDAGYMRFALFYGMFFSFFLYSCFLYFIFKVSLFNRSYFLFFIFLALLTFVFHYKGEVVLFAISYNKLLFLMVFYIYFSSKVYKREKYYD